MIKIIQLWMNLNVHQYHPNSDEQNNPTVDEYIWMFFNGSFSSIFGFRTYLDTRAMSFFVTAAMKQSFFDALHTNSTAKKCYFYSL